MLLKNVLILSDYPDLIRHQQVDPSIVRQIYALLFLLKPYADMLHVNDRSGWDYGHLWLQNSDLRSFIDPFLIHRPWDEIPFTEYDLIICHFDYDISLRCYLERRYNGQYDMSDIYVLANPRYKAAQSLFRSATALFQPGGMWPVSDELKTGALRSFKEELIASYRGSKQGEIEETFDTLLRNISAHNKLQKHTSYKRILILDDYKRSFFIGDSTVWVRYLKRVLHHCGIYGTVMINCNNHRNAPRLQELYANTFGANVAISCMQWEQIDYSVFDLIIVESELVMKFLQYISPLYDTQLRNTDIYHIVTLREEHSQDVYHWEFFSNCKTATLADGMRQNEDKEIYVSDQELQAAEQWLESMGINSDDRLVILQNGSTEDKKVLLFEEFIRLADCLLRKEHVKVLIFDDATNSHEATIRAQLTAQQNNRLLFAAGLGLRRDMCLIASKYTRVVIGPCTGIFHLANGAITYLCNKGIRNEDSIPYLFVYTGIQAHDEGYLPRNWWNHSLVECVIIVKQENQHVLVGLQDCPDNVDAFRAIAGDVQCITATMLLSYLSAFVTL